MEASFEQYRVFCHVADCGSVTAAAEKLFISQPAVSRTLKTLESTLGCKLFLRYPKGVKLTPEGRLLYSYIKRGCKNFESGERKLRRLLDLESGEIRIGASDMTLRFFLLPWLERYHRVFPGIKITVTNGPTPETLQYLRDGKIDFGAVSEPFDSVDGLKVRKVRKIRDIFVAGEAFSDLRGKKLPLSALQELPLICLDGKTSTRRYVDTFLRENGVNVAPEFELATSELIVKFAERNLGIGSVVKDFADESIADGKLFEVEFDLSSSERSVCIVYDKSTPVSLAAQKLLAMIEKESV